MALMKKGGNIPKNAIELEERDAIEYQWQQIWRWPNKFDVWAFRAGLVAIAGSTAVTALYINRYQRKKIKLRDFGYITTMMIGMVMPSVATGILHVEFVVNPLLIFKTPCPTCLQMRASLIQTATGFIYPLIFSPVACTLMAFQAGVRIPYYTETYEIFKMWKNIMKPMTRPLLMLLGFQLAVVNGVTYFEAKQFYELQQRFLDYEKKREKKLLMN